jgi:capsular polysaccharide biosynthesis protein
MKSVEGRSHPDGPASVTGCPEFDYAYGQPNLHRMMQFKQDLVAGFGLERGFQMFREKFGLPATAHLRDVTIESQHAVAVSAAEFFHETEPAGEPFVHQPPLVIGDGNHRPISGTTRSQYVACFRDARLVGRSELIDIGGRTLLDVQGNEAGLLDDDVDWDPTVFHAQAHRSWRIAQAERRPPLVVDEAFCLVGAHSDFFGHWMCEYLPKLLAARLSNLMPDVPVLIDAHMPASHREALLLLSGRATSVIEVPAFTAVHVRRLWCAPALSYMPLHARVNERFSWDAISASGKRFQPIVREMQRQFDAALPTSFQSTRHVFLARKTFRHRRLVNSDAIEQAARDMQFTVVYPEDLTFAEQAAIVRSARVIVAPEGSAVFLTFFARPGTTVCILSHPLTESLADYQGLLDPHQVATIVISGPFADVNRNAPGDSDYRIDEKTFRHTLGTIIPAADLL